MPDLRPLCSMTAIYRRCGAHSCWIGLVARLLNRAMSRIVRGPKNDEMRAASVAIEFASLFDMCKTDRDIAALLH